MTSSQSSTSGRSALWIGVRRAIVGDARRPGLLPVTLALVVLAIIFQLQSPLFLSSRNLSNLILQSATLGILTLGVTFVLVIGELDLSLGAVSGVTATGMAIFASIHHWPGWLAIVGALVAGVVIGVVQGTVIIAVKVPSFILTLGAMLIWQGIQLLALEPYSAQMLISDPAITNISTGYLTPGIAWFFAVIFIVVFTVSRLLRHFTARRLGLRAPSSWLSDIVRILAVAAATIAVTVVLNGTFGVPNLLLIVVIALGLSTVLLETTVFGRHVYAVGGNSEAARRTGISVGVIRVSIFAIAGLLAASSGVLDAARGFAVSASSGGGSTILNAIAAAVIGGTSLAGGRGRPAGALLGALVISVIGNGLALLGQSGSTQAIATGVALVIAVIVDTSSRRLAGGVSKTLFQRRSHR